MTLKNMQERLEITLRNKGKNLIIKLFKKVSSQTLNSYAINIFSFYQFYNNFIYDFFNRNTIKELKSEITSLHGTIDKQAKLVEKIEVIDQKRYLIYFKNLQF